jgi:hypothetical protein
MSLSGTAYMKMICQGPLRRSLSGVLAASQAGAVATGGPSGGMAAALIRKYCPPLNKSLNRFLNRFLNFFHYIKAQPPRRRR